MNPYVTTADLKRQLNIDFSFHDDDTYLEMLADTAVEAVQKHSRVNFEEEGMPNTLRQAVLLLAGTWYLERESVTTASVKPLPHAFDYLVDLSYKYDSWG